MRSMLTVNTYATTPATEPLTPTTIDRSYAADEPSHIHIPRPRRVMRPDAAPDRSRAMNDRDAINVRIEV